MRIDWLWSGDQHCRIWSEMDGTQSSQTGTYFSWSNSIFEKNDAHYHLISWESRKDKKQWKFAIIFYGLRY